MTKKQAIQIRITESDKNKLDKYVGLLQQDNPSLNMTSFIMDALENYYSEIKVEEGKKVVKASKFVYRLDDSFTADDVYKLSLEQKELSEVQVDLVDLEEIENSRKRAVNKLTSNFLLTVALQKKAKEHKAILEEKEALLEELKNF